MMNISTGSRKLSPCFRRRRSMSIASKRRFAMSLRSLAAASLQVCAAYRLSFMELARPARERGDSPASASSRLVPASFLLSGAMSVCRPSRWCTMCQLPGLLAPLVFLLPIVLPCLPYDKPAPRGVRPMRGRIDPRRAGKSCLRIPRVGFRQGSHFLLSENGDMIPHRARQCQPASSVLFFCSTLPPKGGRCIDEKTQTARRFPARAPRDRRALRAKKNFARAKKNDPRKPQQSRSPLRYPLCVV